MFGTFIACICSIIVALQLTGPIPYQAMSSIIIALPLLLLAVVLVVPAISWKQIFKTDKQVFPRTYELIFRDKLFFLVPFIVLLFTFYSFYLVIAATDFSLKEVIYWLLAFGITIDMIIIFVRRLLMYSYDKFLLKRLDKVSVWLVKHEREKEAFSWLETAIEVAAKAIDKKNIHVAKDALKAVQTMCEHFMRAASKVGALRPVGTPGPSLLDEVNSLLVYISRRLEWLNSLSLKNNVDPINEEIIGTYAKMSLFFCRFNPDLAKLPLLFVEKCAKTALDAGHDEVVAQTCLTLSEVAKGMLIISKEIGESRKNAIISCLQYLEGIAQAIFQKNKETNLALLMQPFAEVAATLADDVNKQIVERDEVIGELKRILQSFGALDQVLNRLSPQ